MREGAGQCVCVYNKLFCLFIYKNAVTVLRYDSRLQWCVWLVVTLLACDGLDSSADYTPVHKVCQTPAASNRRFGALPPHVIWILLLGWRRTVAGRP